jgi:hypothetical protein
MKKLLFAVAISLIGLSTFAQRNNRMAWRVQGISTYYYNENGGQPTSMDDIQIEVYWLDTTNGRLILANWSTVPGFGRSSGAYGWSLFTLDTPPATANGYFFVKYILNKEVYKNQLTEFYYPYNPSTHNAKVYDFYLRNGMNNAAIFMTVRLWCYTQEPRYWGSAIDMKMIPKNYTW